MESRAAISHDIFISYRRADAERVQPLVEALKRHGLAVWMDQREIEDFAGITASIREGLSKSKALVAWFSAIYPLSRPCQWELTAAFIAAQQEGDPRKRVLVINPEQDPDHIYLPELKDQEYLAAPPAGDSNGYDIVADSLVQHVADLKGTFREIRALVGPAWYPAQATGSDRFVGRLREMWEIHRGLWEGQTVIDRLGRAAVVRLTGMGGMGKSLLAEEYALRFGAAYPGGIFWLTVRAAKVEPTTQQSIEAIRDSAYRSIASFLTIDLKDKSLDEIQGELRAMFAKKGKPFLWVVDDLPAGVAIQDLQRWYAPHPLGRTLITTRSLEFDGIGQAVEIDRLDPGAARELLTRRRPPRDDDENKAVDPILVNLGYHALAVDVTGARIKRTSYIDFLLDLENTEKDALEIAKKFVGQLPNGHEASIAGTLRKSIDLLDENGKDFLRLASILPVYRIPAAMVGAVFGVLRRLSYGDAQQQADEAIQAVLEHSLAESVGDADFSVVVHALVSRTVRYTDTLSDRMTALRSAAIDTLNRVLPAVVDIRNHQSLEACVIHGLYLVQKAETYEEAKLLGWIARFQRERGVYSQAIVLYQKQFKILDKIFGEEHPDTLTSAHNIATILQAQGDLSGAQTLQEKVLEVQKRILGKEHPDTLASMGNLTTMLQAQGDLSGAQTLQEKVLEVQKRILGEEHNDTLTSTNNLAAIFVDRGDLSKARPLVESVLEVQKRILGAGHALALKSMGNLAQILKAQGDLSGAQTLQEKVVEVQKRVLGEEHPDTLVNMGNLTRTLQAQGDLSGAQTHQEKMLEVQKRILGEEHNDTLTSMNSLAAILVDHGDLSGARLLLEKVLEVQKRILGEAHPNTTAFAWNLFTILNDLQDYDAARMVLQENLVWLLSREANTLSDFQQKTRAQLSQSMNDLALRLQAQGDLLGAQELQEKVLEAAKRVLGIEHPNTLKCMNNVALILQAQGDLAGARDLQEKLLEVAKRVLGVEHPDTSIFAINLYLTLINFPDYTAGRMVLQENLVWLLSREPNTLNIEQQNIRAQISECIYNLVTALHTQGDLAGARELQEKVLDVRVRVLGEEHSATLISMANLAAILRVQGDLAGARKLQEKVLEVQTRILGIDHRDTTISAWNLFETLINLPDHNAASAILLKNLAWLMSKDPNSLNSDQRDIRNQLSKFVEMMAKEK